MKLFAMITTAPSMHYTSYALKSFFKYTELSDEDRFILIDNDNNYDESQLEPYPRVELVRNETALAFAENANQAIKYAKPTNADLYLLNNDLIFTPDWLQPLIAFESMLLSPISNREVQYKSDAFNTTVCMELSDYLGNEAGLDALIAVRNEEAKGQMVSVIVPFFCIKIPAVIYNEVGPFDESFGKGGAEDYDYCLRAHLAGFKVAYALDSYLLHFGGKSSWSGVESKTEQRERERIFMEAFEAKWGKALCDLVLRNIRTEETSNEWFHKEIARGNYAQVIQTLQQSG